jgi:hypothetical protein
MEKGDMRRFLCDSATAETAVKERVPFCNNLFQQISLVCCQESQGLKHCEEDEEDGPDLIGICHPEPFCVLHHSPGMHA